MNKTPQYNIEKMINDIVFIIDKVSGRTLE